MYLSIYSILSIEFVDILIHEISRNRKCQLNVIYNCFGVFMGHEYIYYIYLHFIFIIKQNKDKMQGCDITVDSLACFL